ncbi:hypothetical protein B0H14DRAFT_3137833 [Mycena olivaceomarginata]|nr:hypothetical protein B0H14DRAFT_3137833 [Mycena olivaceomarginata]
MLQEFDPFNPDPNSESYLPDAESPGRSKPRFRIHGYNLKPRRTKRNGLRVRTEDIHEAGVAQYLDVDQTTESTDPGEAPFVLVAWDAYLARIAEGDENCHRTGETMSDPGHEPISSENSSQFSGSPRKWFKFQ